MLRLGYFQMSQFLMKWLTILLQSVRTCMLVLIPYEVIFIPPFRRETDFNAVHVRLSNHLLPKVD